MTIYGRATFEPTKAELPATCDWISFGVAKGSDDAEQLARDRAWNERNRLDLQQILPESFVRKLVLESAHLDLLISGELGAVVSVDPFHGRLLNARVRAGEAYPVFGETALTTVFPDVGELSWQDIGEVRRHKDIRYLRDLLAEIGAAAADVATSGQDLAVRIHRDYEQRLHEAIEGVSESTRGQRIVAATALVVGEAVGVAAGLLASSSVGAPMVGTMVGEGIKRVSDRLLPLNPSKRWLAPETEIRRRVRGSRMGSG